MNDFLFGVVMRKEEFCKPLLEKILGVKIKKIVYAKDEVDITAAVPGAKSVRLDVYVEDDDNTVYDIEVQTTNKRNLGKRTRYYQSMIDIRVLEAGQNYRKLKKSFVIFICNYDPFGENRYIYTFQNRCNEDPDLVLDDEATKIIINTKGKIGDISDELKAVIKYMDSGDATDEYTEDLAKEVESVKSDEKVRKEYMLLAEAYAERERIADGKRVVRLIRRKMDIFDIAEMADLFDVSIPECENVVKLIKEHPDWDDEQVATEIDWED
jgi:predicted transposase/invertase (TIGR01784 family)